MPNNKKNGQLKMSLGDFMGGQPATGMAALPTRPKERGPDDDGSFKRRSDYNDNRKEQEISRSDGDSNWRRGGSSSTGGSLRGGGGYDDRRGGGGYTRRGGGGYERYDNSRDRDVAGFDRKGGYNDSRNGFDNFDRKGTNRGGYDNYIDRGVSGFDSFRRGTPAGDEKNLPSSKTGMRPRLQLKTRTVPLPESPKIEAKEEISEIDEQISENLNPVEAKEGSSNNFLSSNIDEKDTVDTLASGDDGWETVEGIKNKSLKEAQVLRATEERDLKESRLKSKKREPVNINSRAAMLESAPDVKRDSNSRKDNERSRGPPPVINKRFEELADEERGKQRDREARRGPPPAVNSRFAAAAQADQDLTSATNNRSDTYDSRHRGPPPVANSRFAAAAQADRDKSYNRGDNDRGPPPTTNSRFAAAAEADRDFNYNREKNTERIDERGRGPPQVTNSRFAAAAEADSDYNRDRDDFDGGRGGRRPPSQTNSRFAAAAEADRSRSYNRDGNNSIMDNRNRGPPPVANSRFAAAAEADRDYNRDHDDYNGDRIDRSSNRDYYDDRRGYDNGSGERFNESRYQQQEKQPQKSSVADLLKPKARPMEENILKVPTKEQSANFLTPPSKERLENSLKLPSKAKNTADPQSEKRIPPTPSEADNTAILAEFVTGNKLGNDLKTWLEAQECIPRVEKLVYTLLIEKEKSTPDLECAWAEPNNYGSALLSLVEDDLLKQMEVLFAIQKYCDKIGFPKVENEYVVQAMFRSMYKYDLADDETFALWKEDESHEHETGKLKAVIQTVEWFNWLEEDDEEDDDDEEE